MGEQKQKLQTLRAKAQDEMLTAINHYNSETVRPDDCTDDCNMLYYKEGQTTEERLAYLDKHLASLRSTVESLTSLIFSQRLSSESDDNLRKFLNHKNLKSRTNYEELVTGVAHALIYGRAGFRWLNNGDMLFVPSDEYTVVYAENETYRGFNEVLNYIVRRPQVGDKYGKAIDIDKQVWSVDLENDVKLSDDYVWLDKNQFFNFYFFGNEIDSDTPLNHDLDRIEIFLSLMQRLAQSIDASNADTIVAQLKNDTLSMNSLQVGDLVAQSKTIKKTRAETIKNELINFVKKLSKLTKRKTIILPNSIEKLETLGDNVTINEFLKLYEYSESFISKLYGLSANVLNLDKMPRDASANPIFEQMMKTSVFPKRDTIEQFMNSFIKDKIKSGQITFGTESYTVGTKITNAQNYANVVATLKASEHDLDDSEVKTMINSLLKVENN